MDLARDNELRHPGLPDVLALVDPGLKRFGVVFESDWNWDSEEDGSGIVVGGDKVHAHRRLKDLAAAVGVHHRLVNVVAVHRDAAELRQRAGMDVEGLGRVQTFYRQEIAREGDVVEPVDLDELLVVGRLWSASVEKVKRYIEPTGSFVDAAAKDVRANRGDLYAQHIARASVADQILEPRTATRPRSTSQNAESDKSDDHCQSPLMSMPIEMAEV